jgi:hypothetical protein
MNHQTDSNLCPEKGKRGGFVSETVGYLTGGIFDSAGTGKASTLRSGRAISGRPARVKGAVPVSRFVGGYEARSSILNIQGALS